MEIESMPVKSRIISMMPSLKTAERRVAEYLLHHWDGADGELTVAAVAQGSGSSAGTVVRTCRSLGYQGYQQVRVLIARDRLAASTSVGDNATAPDSASDSTPSADGKRVHDRVATLANQLPLLMGTLSDKELDAAVKFAGDARRILVIANGLSAPIGASFTSRLLRNGFDVACFTDTIDQHIAASMLTDDCLVFVFSGSGANTHTLAAVRAAKDAGARIVALTYFAASPLIALADVTLLVGPPNLTLDSELKDVSRVALMVLSEALASEMTCDGTQSPSSPAFTAISQHLEDTDE
ncbi:MurR/RpiR family transcriptional regulator [Bifidobacterium sp. UBA744]|uniref:MurR/RpiR family transcriptional regulator n=1 Tax=Bifidobacterium sp. UBA744 TaxID=1946112 RepID=UPI0025BC2D66|nr:MurR/RpiR family transcriptional regulator [Bifidobacterium sp. UBA744]